MYTFGDYEFDSTNLIIYKSDSEHDVIELAKKLSFADNDYDSVFSSLSKINSDKMTMNKIALSQFGICLTYNCNLRCNYCGYSSGNNNHHKLELSDIELFVIDILKKKAIKKLTTGINEPLVINITGGGEPTYDWVLFKHAVLFIKNSCITNDVPYRLKLTTNGLLFDEQIDFISENFDEVMVSYDGLPDIQDKNRKCPSDDSSSLIVESTIRKFALKKMSLVIRSTIWQEDSYRMIDMYQHIFSLVPKNYGFIWSIYPTLFEGRAINNMCKQEHITYKDFLEHYFRLVDFIISTEGESSLQNIDMPLINDEFCGLFCGAYRGECPWLMPDKSIITCIESKNDKVVIGNIENGTLKYKNTYKDSFLKVTQTKYSECRKCIAYRFCRGGCPVWHLRDGKLLREPLECEVQKMYWIHVINSLLKGKYSFGWNLEKIIIQNNKDYSIFKLVKKTS